MSNATTIPTSTPPPTVAGTSTPVPASDWHIAPQQVVLALVLLFEVAIFGLLSEHFLTPDNLFTVLTHSVELGLLALALTPIILTGGIDLSVGSSPRLAAGLLRVLSRHPGTPPAPAAPIAPPLPTLPRGV